TWYIHTWNSSIRFSKSYPKAKLSVRRDHLPSTSTKGAGNLCQLVCCCGHTRTRRPNRNPLKTRPVTVWQRTCPSLSKTRRAPLIVFVLLVAILMLVGITAVSAIDFTNGKRR